MAARKPASTEKSPKRTTRPRRKKAEPKSKGLSPAEVASGQLPEAEALVHDIQEDGGAALASYRDPLGGHPVVLATLPIDKVEPTPYQRDISETHVKRLASAMERVDRYLDPIIAVRHDGRYWTPNGSHRLGASRLLGAKAVMALVLPEEDVAYQILALNTEKAHNLKERSLEVIRMYRGLVGAKGGKETDYAALFEEASFATLGACYEKRPRYSGGAYHPVVKRCEEFLDLPLEECLRIHEARADKLLRLDDAVIAVVDGLKERGLTSPYLKNFVVARINFLRFKRGSGIADFDPTIDRMLASAEKFDVSGVKKEDLTRMGGGAHAEGDEE